MSTIKVNKIENTSTTNGGVSIDNDGHVTIDGQQLPTAGPLSNRNLIINGAMQVAQRGTASTSSGINSVDRWYGIFDQGAVTQSQEAIDLADQPFTEDGLRNYFRLTNNTASTAAAAFRGFTQIIEAQNAATSGWNYTSSSSFITLSFWVRASVSQKFYGQLLTMDGTVQNYVFSFTPAANTWTKVVKTIPGNSNSQINLDNGEGIRVRIMPYWGTNFTDSGVAEDTWFAWTSGTRVPDMATNWTSTTSATFDVTGVQLEVGSKATPFEHRSYGDEELRCMRYYQRFGGTLPSSDGTDDGFMTFANYTATTAYGGQKFTVPMRGRPTMVASGCAYYSNGSTDNSINVDMIGASTNYGELHVTGFSLGGGNAGWLRIEGGGAYIEFNAEL